MGALLKYEFRKTWFSKAILLAVTGLIQVFFLISIARRAESHIGTSVLILFLAAVMGTMYIGIESMLLLQRDLNTKQSYMLFMTPNSTYKILGAKVLENALSLFLCGLFFGTLALIDGQILLKYLEMDQSVIDYIASFLNGFGLELDLSRQTMGSLLFLALADWLQVVVSAFLAIVVSATFMSGKKLSGLVSFALFIGIRLLVNYLMGLLPALAINAKTYIFQGVLCLVISGLLYVITALIMDKKLSV